MNSQGKLIRSSLKRFERVRGEAGFGREELEVENKRERGLDEEGGKQGSGGVEQKSGSPSSGGAA